MEIKENLVSGKNLVTLKQKKIKSCIYENIKPILQKEYEEEGWELDKIYSKHIRMKKPKPIDILFEDEVWITFANLGFKYLNKDRNFIIPYSLDEKLTQQIDVFAVDDETIVIIECKATKELQKKSSFKETIEALGGKKEGILKSIRSIFPEKKFKAKFIFATKNYILSEPDNERLNKFDIIYFDEETLQYYNELSKHLGISARYQLLGNLFEGQKIPQIENIIPAIEGTIGGHKYYSFSIEPEKLLKIGYILHRNKAHKKFMPTYQRLIKKPRLIAIQDFINKGGFFPNSIIINIETKGNGLRFDISSLQVENSRSRIGLLYLPQKYQSAYIIDGQHRLYGYADSKYKNNNTIPVIAFIDLKREEQVKLFMEINENQKAVPKNLRNTLDSDLLWYSPIQKEQRRALMSQIAQDLGEEKISPLYERVIVGEELKTLKCCIMIETIKSSLNASNFISQFKGNSIFKDGTFDKGDNDSTYELLFNFLILCFDYIKEFLPEEWDKGEANDGFITINIGIYSFIRIFSDIIDHLILNSDINPKSDKLADILSEMKYYLDPLVNYLKVLPTEEKEALRKSYGSGGKLKYWRSLQRAIAECRNEFNPPGMKQYWIDNAKSFNEESFRMIRDIEGYLKNNFKEKLLRKYGENWFRYGLPKPVYDAAHKLAADKNYENESGEKIEPWDCLMIINYREIATYGSNWSELFEKDYTKPGEEKISGGKQAKTEWLTKLNKIRNQNFHTYSVTGEEYKLLKELYEWLIKEKFSS